MEKSVFELIERSLVELQEADSDLDLSHAIQFFEVANLMHEFMATISCKSLDPKWEQYLNAFQSAAKEFFRPCQHIGK